MECVHAYVLDKTKKQIDQLKRELAERDAMLKIALNEVDSLKTQVKEKTDLLNSCLNKLAIACEALERYANPEQRKVQGDWIEDDVDAGPLYEYYYEDIPVGRRIAQEALDKIKGE